MEGRAKTGSLRTSVTARVGTQDRTAREVSQGGVGTLARTAREVSQGECVRWPELPEK